MDSFFTALGRDVRERWKAANFSLASFPGIACSVLEARRPADHVDVASLVRDFLLCDEQPFQTQSGFGEPELIVYDDPRFYIQILFWLDGTTDIHQHQFSGAFHVLAGSSIHSRFKFENSQPISAHLCVGELLAIDTRLLPTGATEPIISGGGYIHSLFHLDTPSATVVVRTHNDPGSGLQFTYLPPHLALDPLHQDALTARRKQLLDMLEKTEDAAYEELVSEMIADLDFERGFFILQNGMGYLRRLGCWEEMLSVFQLKHGALADGVAPTLEEIVRRDGLVAMRGSVADPEHRFFLALLLNVPHAQDILALTAERIPGLPTETILRWVEELSVTSDAGTWILDAEFPEELNVSIEQQSELYLSALRYFLLVEKGLVPIGLDQLDATDLSRLHDSFVHSSFRALIPAQ